MASKAVHPAPRIVAPRRPSLATACEVWGSPLDPCLPPHPREPGLWYALRIAPQAEFVTAHLLRRRGVVAWAPCLTKWVQADRHRRLVKQAVRRPLLVGYGFVKLDRTALWERVFSLSAVLGVVSLSGRPWPIRACDIARVRHASSRLRARERDRLMPTNRGFDVGDEVEVLDGPLDGFRVRVQAIEDGKARALLRLFGRESEALIPLAQLGAVA